MAPWKSLQEIGDFDSLVPWDRPLERAPFDRYVLWSVEISPKKSSLAKGRGLHFFQGEEHPRNC